MNGYDKLYRRHERAMARKRFTAAAVAVSLIALFAGLAVYARKQAYKAENLKDEQVRITKETQLREAKLTWLPRAQKATVDRQFPANVLYAARALGFRGYGYERLTEDQQKLFDIRFPQLFDFKQYPDLRQDLRQPMEGDVRPLLPFWSSPVVNHDAGSVKSVAFSPDGKTLASGSLDETIKLWDMHTGQERATLRGHSGPITSAAFSPDGKTLASGSELDDDETSISLWDVASIKLDLAGYLLGQWYEFDETTGDVSPAPTVKQNLLAPHRYAFLNVGRWTHVGVLQSAKSPEEANRLLFEHYLRNAVWIGAFTLLDQHMDRSVDPLHAFIVATRVLRERGDLAEALIGHDKPSSARMNLAHAYLFNGQFEKARAIYSKYLGTVFEDGRKWNDELRNDFKLLREAGHDHPDMKKIEAMLE